MKNTKKIKKVNKKVVIRCPICFSPVEVIEAHVIGSYKCGCGCEFTIYTVTDTDVDIEDTKCSYGGTD